jgi:CelD/BcsL family acetyltransferase involved in cellulose biosynthesis
MRTSFVFNPERRGLLQEWKRLYALAEPNFFLSPAWVETWLASLPIGVRLAAVRVFDDLRGVYAMALVGAPERKSAIAPRTAHLHESGMAAADAIYIEYNDILVARDAPAGAREAAVAAIIEGFPKVDEFVFRNVRRPLAIAVRSAAHSTKCEARQLRQQPTFQIDLRGGPLLDRFSASLRSKIRRSMRRYELRGPVLIERTSPGPAREVAWTELMRLHSDTWSRRGLPGAFSERAFSNFHETLIATHPAAVDFVRLEIKGEAIGVLYNFLQGDRVCNYQSGFRYESDNRLAPGFVCHALAAERYREDGFAVYDLMAGEAEYKRRLGVEGESLETVTLMRRGLRALPRTIASGLRSVRA